VTLTGPGRMATLASYVPRAVLRHVASLSTTPVEPHADGFPAALLLIDITGFTPITAAAVRRGAAGTEQLSRSLNAYLGQIIDLIAQHGGDISKFVGDALIPIWPALDEDLATVTRRAATCALAIAADFGELEVESDLRLSLKVGLCAGEIAATHVGGLDERWLFLITGACVSELSELERHLRTGDVVAAPEGWALVSDRFVGQPLQQGYMRLVAGKQELTPRPLGPVPLSPTQELAVRAYIPQVLLSRLDAGQADWLAELRRTTVVFANIRGIGNSTPDALHLLHRITQVAQRILGRYDGWLKEITMDDKGTTLVAAFGVPPFTHEDDSARAIEAALTIQSEIRELGLTAGLGVATGPTFYGPIGNATRRDLAMLGEHVNLAARLMQASSDGAVLCDAATYETAQDRQAFERLPAYVLKGMATPIDVYRAPAAGVVASRRSLLIDRIAEMAAASATLEALKGGAGGLVILEGEPGIGKSRLANEWVRRAQELGLRALIGSASEIEVSTPYHAWRSVFDRLLGMEAVVDRGARRALVLDRLSSDAESLRLAPLLGPVLSIDLPDNEATGQLTGAVRADNTRDLLIDLIRREAAKGPLMIVIEDAHWLDSASWSLVLQVPREIPPILLVVTRRPMGDIPAEPVPTMQREATTLRLSALSPDDAVALAAERTGAMRLEGSVATVVQDRADGNPLFIEQLIYAMRDAGRIVVDHGLLRVASGIDDVEGAIIPDTVQRVITTRLDHLPPEQAMTLKVASVIGPRFALRTLEDIYPLPTEAAELVDHLETLTRLDLVAPASGAPEPAYEFRHKITQEVAYNLMPSEQSRQLHRALAEWHERTYAADLSPFHAFLAHHWGKAGVPGRAVDHLDLAGAQALRTFANDEAVGFLEQALSLDAATGDVIDRSRRARWHLQLGEAFVNQSKYREGRDHLEIGLRLLKRPAPATRWQQTVWLLAEVIHQGLRRVGLIRSVRRMTDAELADLVAVNRAYERLAEAAYYGAETLLPLYCVIHILNLSEASGSPPEMARGFAGTGALFGLVPLPRVAESYLRRALTELARVEDLTTHEIVGIVVGFHYIGAGRWDLAREQFRAVRKTARRLGDRRRLEDAVENMMELESMQGSFQTAADLADDLITMASAWNDRRFHAEGLAGKAYCAWQLGDADAALRAVADFKAIVPDEAHLTDELRIKSQGVLALMHLSRGERTQAYSASEEAMRLTGEQRPTYFGTYLGYLAPAEVYLDLWEGREQVRDAPARVSEALKRMRRFASVFPAGRPRYATLEGRRSWLLGRQGRAFRSWRRALAIATELSMDFEQGLAHNEIGRHLEPGDPDRVVHLEAARAIFQRLKAARVLAAVEPSAALTAPG
jgi:class 3 adenylate cyclase/tetratricopeptide (TPR) repeat protein